MRRVLLLSAAAVMALVPAGAGVYAAFFPRHNRILPVGFRLLWLLGSLWATFYAPVVVDRLTRNLSAAIAALPTRDGASRWVSSTSPGAWPRSCC